jgi:hypothetical protein
MPDLSSARALFARVFGLSRPRPLLLALSLGVATYPAAGCTGVPKEVPGDIAAVLEKPERFEIFNLDSSRISPRLDPETGLPVEPNPPPAPGPPAFHDHRIVGQVEVADARQRERIVSLVYKGIRSSDGLVAACFNPRHGVRATREGRTVELVICFECLQINAYGPDGKEHGLMTSDRVTADMNEAFQAAGLRL